MAELNKLNCGTDAKNTGTGSCPFDLALVRKFLKVPKGRSFTAAEIADIEQTLRDGILAAKAQRIYPFPNWEQITDNSEDVQVGTYGYGGKYFGRQGDNDWTFDFVDGALCASKALKSHKGKGYYLIVDSNYRIIGTKVGEELQGVPMLMEVLKPKAADGTNPTKYSARFIFDADYIWDNIGFIDKVAGFNPLLLEGLQDIVLKVYTGSTATSVKLTATTGCDKADLGLTFETELETAANWIGKAAVGGASVTPTAVAYTPGVNGATGFFTLTFAAAVASVTLVDAAALATAGIEGFEANVLTTVTA